MGEAVRLLIGLPIWFFEAAADPFAAGLLTVIPFLGTLSLGAGLLLGAVRRRLGLLFFLVPVCVSHLFVAIAGAMGGYFSYDSEPGALPYLLAFLALEAVLVFLLIYVAKGSRVAAGMLGFFCASYALLAYFIAAMAFTDTWL